MDKYNKFYVIIKVHWHLSSERFEVKCGPFDWGDAQEHAHVLANSWATNLRGLQIVPMSRDEDPGTLP